MTTRTPSLDCDLIDASRYGPRSGANCGESLHRRSDVSNIDFAGKTSAASPVSTSASACVAAAATATTARTRSRSTPGSIGTATTSRPTSSYSSCSGCSRSGSATASCSSRSATTAANVIYTTSPTTTATEFDITSCACRASRSPRTTITAGASSAANCVQGRGVDEERVPTSTAGPIGSSASGASSANGIGVGVAGRDRVGIQPGISATTTTASTRAGIYGITTTTTTTTPRLYRDPIHARRCRPCASTRSGVSNGRGHRAKGREAAQSQNK